METKAEKKNADDAEVKAGEAGVEMKEAEVKTETETKNTDDEEVQTLEAGMETKDPEVATEAGEKNADDEDVKTEAVDTIGEPDENGWIAHVDPDTQQTYYIHSESGVLAQYTHNFVCKWVRRFIFVLADGWIVCETKV